MTDPSPYTRATPQRDGAWSDHDVQLLRERYPHEPTHELAAEFGRSYVAVRIKAHKLGLAKTPEFLSWQSAHAVRQRTDRYSSPLPAMPVPAMPVPAARRNLNRPRLVRGAAMSGSE